jgi:hypothetical protein
MVRSLRLAFLIPALLITAPVVAQERTKTVSAPIRYVTLDRMIRSFAAEAQHHEHAARNAKRPTVLAQR